MGTSSKVKWPVSLISPMKCLCCVAPSGSFSFREEPQVTGRPTHSLQDAITMASIKTVSTIHKTQMRHMLISPESRLHSDKRNFQHKKVFFAGEGLFFKVWALCPRQKAPAWTAKSKPQKCDLMAPCTVTSEKQDQERRLWKKRSEPRVPHFLSRVR